MSHVEPIQEVFTQFVLVYMFYCVLHYFSNQL